MNDSTVVSIGIQHFYRNGRKMFVDRVDCVMLRGRVCCEQFFAGVDCGRPDTHRKSGFLATLICLTELGRNDGSVGTFTSPEHPLENAES